MTDKKRCAVCRERGCTQAEYQEAQKQALLLCTRLLKGPYAELGWRPVVHENLGWHYTAVSNCGRIKVIPGSARSYVAFLGEKGGIGGRWAEHGGTPAAAIRATLKVATEQRDGINAVLAGLS